MTVRYPAIDDYIAIAVAVTGQQVVTLVNATDTALADSALHGPSASFAGEDFYPTSSTRPPYRSCIRRDHGLRYIDVWDTQTDWERFRDERVSRLFRK